MDEKQELADKLGVTRSRIGMYETAKREPDFESLEAIADFFSVLTAIPYLVWFMRKLNKMQNQQTN